MVERILLNVNLILFMYLLFKKLRRGLHILQLENYHNDRYLLWIRKNFLEVFKPFELILYVGSILLMIFNQTYPAFIIQMISILIMMIFARKRKEKKAFVVTARIKRMYITLLLIEAIVVAVCNIVNNNIASLIIIDITLLVGYLFVYIINILNVPVEALIRRKFCNMAKKKLKDIPDLKVIGITGSYGKTSTKNAVNSIISVKYNSLMTPESYNTTMGVVRTINEKLEPINNAFVCEMGAKYVGDIKEICDIVKPQYAIITAIGPQHLDTFKTLDNVRKTKLELVDSLPEDGIAFVNWEDENIRESTINCKNIIKYGLSKECDYYAENVEISEFGSTFDVVLKDGRRVDIKTKLLGKLNILNIICAAAVADVLGMSENQIKIGAKFIKPVEHRLQLKKNPNGSIIIDDAYNSNVKGASMALDVLKSFKGRKRILITPGIVELGDKQFEINEKLGINAAKSADYVILVGEKQAVPIKEGLEKAKYKEENIYIAKNINEAIEKMKAIMDSNTVVLLENDLPDNYL